MAARICRIDRGGDAPVSLESPRLLFRKVVPRWMSGALWGERVRWGPVPDPTDSTWLEWCDMSGQFYEQTQKQGIGRAGERCWLQGHAPDRSRRSQGARDRSGIDPAHEVLARDSPARSPRRRRRAHGGAWGFGAARPRRRSHRARRRHGPATPLETRRSTLWSRSTRSSTSFPWSPNSANSLRPGPGRHPDRGDSDRGRSGLGARPAAHIETMVASEHVDRP